MLALDRIRRGGRQTVKVVHQYVAVGPGGQAARARQEQAHALWDEAIDNIRFADTQLKVVRARVFLKATAKLAGKLAPKVYGDVLEEPGLPVVGEASIAG